MNKNKGTSFSNLVESIQIINNELSMHAGRAVNTSLTIRNWLIGGYIHHYELNGNDRAKYGEKLLRELAKRLKNVSNCNNRQLYRYIRFYRLYPQIVGTVSPQFKKLIPSYVVSEKVGTVSPQLHLSAETLLSNLSYSHFDLIYVSWYKKNIMSDGDNPPVGILLCTEKDHALVEYALAGMSENLFISKYQLELPNKEEMINFVEEKIRKI